MDAHGNLVICDTLKGLTMLDREGHLSVLTNRVGLDSPLQPGTPLRYVNDLDIADDGALDMSVPCRKTPEFLTNNLLYVLQHTTHHRHHIL